MAKIFLKIKRRKEPEEDSYWEDFEVSYFPQMTVISALREIQKKPVNKVGDLVKPVAWACNCLEEVCGACTMLVNGRVRLACSAFIDEMSQPIVLEPLSKFPIVRDLVVDRSRMHDHLVKIKDWIPFDGSDELGPGPKYTETDKLLSDKLSQCIGCGACLEACPQYQEKSPYIGAQALLFTSLLHLHPRGESHKEKRLDILMEKGGIEDCENAGCCERVCPKEIPLIQTMARMKRIVTKHALKKLFG